MLNSDAQDMIVKFVYLSFRLEHKDYPTEEELHKTVEKAFTMYEVISNGGGYSEEDKKLIIERVEEERGITQPLGVQIVDENQDPWVRSRIAAEEMFYWRRYKKLLVEEKGWPNEVVNVALDEDTTKILDLCGNPNRTDSWDRRGMVMGYVQSGKTANYIGLMTKAADMGYKVFIVITGILEELRVQTQSRIDEGFIGMDSGDFQKALNIGVGVDSDDSKRPATLTSTQRDFVGNAAQANFVVEGMNTPVVFVVKKNTATLRKLANWLKRNATSVNREIIDVPVMIIDDEADNASINTKYSPDDDSNITKINEQIRRILSLFSRNTYVGYTATPFANIFIDPDVYDEEVKQDLFPRSFIFSLEPSSNYFGADEIFSSDENYISLIEDSEAYLPVKHKKDFDISELPPSLLDAVRYFILTTSIRYKRGHSTENISMMVNVSRFTRVHKNVAVLIQTYLKKLLDSLYFCKSGKPDENIRDLQKTWDSISASNLYSFDEIFGLLEGIISELEVIVVNSASSDSLKYNKDTYRKVIAVGGFSLSRGLTLEGLHVSYLLRNSMMYDTLMQMGRWFGYRNGYKDLCRLYLTKDEIDRYQSITSAISDLRDELNKMSRSGRTPKDFGLKVRTYPGALTVTARNKMKSARELTMFLDYSGKIVDSRRLYLDDVSLSRNREAMKEFIEQLNSEGKSLKKLGRSWYVSGVAKEKIIEFLGNIIIPKANELSSPKLLLTYLEATSRFESWDVVVPSIQGQGRSEFAEDIGLEVNPQTRTFGKVDYLTEYSTNRKMVKFSKSRVSSKGITSIGMTQEEIEDARKFAVKGKDDADKYFLCVRKRPLLGIHIFNFTYTDTGEVFKDVIAFTLAFPDVGGEPTEPITYIVNKVELSEYLNMSEGELGNGEDDE